VLKLRGRRNRRLSQWRIKSSLIRRGSDRLLEGQGVDGSLGGEWPTARVTRDKYLNEPPEPTLDYLILSDELEMQFQEQIAL